MPSLTTPAPMAAHCWSPEPAISGSPSGSPERAAAAAETEPIRAPDSTRGGSFARSIPVAVRMRSDQPRAAKSTSPSVQAAVSSARSSPAPNR